MPEKLIKSKQRVKDFAEVFTPKHIVKNMCDLVPEEMWVSVDTTFLEPACGTGNFLAEILARKLELCKSWQDGLIALKSVYGIDIQMDNVIEARQRLFDMYIAKFPKSPRFVRYNGGSDTCEQHRLRRFYQRSDDKQETEAEMKFKVSTTVTSYKEAMALVNALVGVVDEVEMIDEEDEEDDQI